MHTDFRHRDFYTIRTIKPGSVVGRKGRKAMQPHVNFWLLLSRHHIGLATRISLALRGGVAIPRSGA